MSYIKDNFLLTTKTAEILYNEYAKNMPIFDYHCHLPEKQMLENKPFSDVFEIWLAGDHYKWRAMRLCGVDEEFITGVNHFDVMNGKLAVEGDRNDCLHRSLVKELSDFDVGNLHLLGSPF